MPHARCHHELVAAPDLFPDILVPHNLPTLFRHAGRALLEAYDPLCYILLPRVHRRYLVFARALSVSTGQGKINAVGYGPRRHPLQAPPNARMGKELFSS